jgi:hypothetical protein
MRRNASTPLGMLALVVLGCAIGCEGGPAPDPDRGGAAHRPELATPQLYRYTLELGAGRDPHEVRGSGSIRVGCDEQGTPLPFGLHFEPSAHQVFEIDGQAEGDSSFVVVTSRRPCMSEGGASYAEVPIQWRSTAGPGLQVWQTQAGPNWLIDPWPDRSRTLWPVADHPSRAAQWEVTIRAPAGQTVLASGNRVAEPDGASTWQTSRPVPTKAWSFIAARLDTVLDSGRLQAFAPPERAAEFARTVAPLGRVVAWAESVLGPLPVDTLRVVLAPTRFGGMENAGLIALSSAPQGREAERLLMHEVVHQWIGTAVSEARWSDLWISEGAATWLAAQYGRERWGEAWYQAAASGWDPQWNRLGRDEAPSQALASVYAVGAGRFESLADEVGAGAVRRALRTLVEDSGPALSADRLRLALERESGYAFGDFFEPEAR